MAAARHHNLDIRSTKDIWFEIIFNHIRQVMVLLYCAVESCSPQAHREVAQMIDQMGHQLQKKKLKKKLSLPLVSFKKNPITFQH